jgi:hypothetical protein
VVAAVIASMFGASAFAFYAHTPRTTAADVTPPAPVASAPAIEPVVTPRRVSTQVAPPLVIDAIEERTVEPARMPLPAPAASVPVPPAPEPPVAQAAQRDPELAMYAEAHKLHFRDRDMAAALAAWNRYLAAAPDGELAPEARFNRVVALVKLERWTEASHDLDTLADSTFRAAELARLRAVVSSHHARTR